MKFEYVLKLQPGFDYTGADCCMDESSWLSKPESNTWLVPDSMVVGIQVEQLEVGLNRRQAQPTLS